MLSQGLADAILSMIMAFRNHHSTLVFLVEALKNLVYLFRRENIPVATQELMEQKLVLTISSCHGQNGLDILLGVQDLHLGIPEIRDAIDSIFAIYQGDEEELIFKDSQAVAKDFLYSE